MSIVRAVHLEQWAGTNIARDKLGELLRVLIHAGIPMSAIQYIRFLANESNQLAGWDGLLECHSSVPWIPNGTSVWELGAGRSGNPRDKIKSDFVNRRDKELPSGWSKAATTYVAVALRKLDDLTLLENELKKDSPWQDVKVYDAQTLEEWIERFSGPQAWLQEQRIGPAPSIHTLEWSWQEWSEGTQPKVSTKLVLADREKHAQDLRSALKTSGTVISVQADSPEEALAFVYAAIDKGEPGFREHFLARSIVVNKNDDAELLRGSPPQCVILRPPVTEKALMLTHSGHTVINAFGNSSLKSDFRLTRSLRSNFADALVEMGITKEHAKIEARACGASPSLWRVWNQWDKKVLLSNIPEWAKDEHARLMVPAVLMGGWSDRFEGDKEVVKEITGQEFEEYRDNLHQFVSSDNPILTKIDDAWVITAPVPAFALVINHITIGHLEKLSKIVNDVFKEIDPTVDLPPDERPYAATRTKGMRHSTWLRDGLAETLLRIVVIGDRLKETGVIPNNQSCQSYVDQLIRILPGLSEDWRLLASLRNQLPVLAEAAPTPFLEALERLLQGEPEKIRPIFAEGDSMFGHAFHPNLLWALETLAWEPNLLGRVALILARLAKIDPGGHLSNRPINSLREILLAWHPNTSANLEERLQVLDLIIEREPKIGWALLSVLLPNLHEIAHHTHEPIWKDFGRSNRKPLTRLIVWKAYEEFVNRALKYAGIESSRWKTLIGIYPNVAVSHQQEIEKGLEELSKADLSQEARKDIWETLREFVNRHRGFPESSWALPGDRLDRLDAIKAHFAPIDYLDQTAWLFNEHFPDIPFPRKPLEEMKLALEKLRSDAIEELWKEGGITSLIALLDRVALPGLVAPLFLGLMQKQNEEETLNVFEKTTCGTDNQRAFARHLSGDGYKRFGDHWTDLVRSRATDSSWTAETIVNAILYYPDSMKTFDIVSSFGPEVEQCYWEERRGWFHADDSATFAFAIEKMLWARRALDIVAQLPNELAEINVEQILRILDQALEELNEGKTSRVVGDVSYWIEKLFDMLRGRNDVDKASLARREYKYLPLLTRHFEKKDLTLHEFLATDPDFFVEVLCDLYKPASRNQENDEITEEQHSRADFAWKLLQSWRQPPGVEKEGSVNGPKLREWVNKARLLAFKKDRANIADENIGKILFYFPTDPNDTAWPHIELRDLLENLESEHVERGIELEQFNSRGTTSRAFFEGGAQERALAQKWRNWADTLGVRWPRTKAMLDRIADYWEADAKREDLEAEKDRLRYG